MPDTTTALRLNGREHIRPASDTGGAVTRNLAVENVQLAEPAAGEVLVEPLYVGICGSDVHASLGAPNFSWVERPRTIGHEFCGRIIGFGPNTEGWGGFERGSLVEIASDEPAKESLLAEIEHLLGVFLEQQLE